MWGVRCYKVQVPDGLMVIVGSMERAHVLFSKLESILSECRCTCRLGRSQSGWRTVYSDVSSNARCQCIVRWRSHFCAVYFSQRSHFRAVHLSPAPRLILACHESLHFSSAALNWYRSFVLGCGGPGNIRYTLPRMYVRIHEIGARSPPRYPFGVWLYS